MNPDLNPHKSALMAIFIYASRYSQQNLGSMGFWKSLSKSQKSVCREAVERIEKARKEAAPKGKP